MVQVSLSNVVKPRQELEKIAALLKVISCFIAPEPPAFDMEEFFPFSHRHFVNLGGNPRMAGMVQQSHVTPDSALQCTYPLLKYTIGETTELVAKLASQTIGGCGEYVGSPVEASPDQGETGNLHPDLMSSFAFFSKIFGPEVPSHAVILGFIFSLNLSNDELRVTAYFKLGCRQIVLRLGIARGGPFWILRLGMLRQRAVSTTHFWENWYPGELLDKLKNRGEAFTRRSSRPRNLPALTPKVHLAGFSFMLYVFIKRKQYIPCGVKRKFSPHLVGTWEFVVTEESIFEREHTMPGSGVDYLVYSSHARPMMALNKDRSSTTKYCTFKITGSAWTGSTMSPREVVEDPLNPDSIHLRFFGDDGGNPIYLNATICNRSTELSRSTRIFLTLKSLIPSVRMRALSSRLSFDRTYYFKCPTLTGFSTRSVLISYGHLKSDNLRIMGKSFSYEILKGVRLAWICWVAVRTSSSSIEYLFSHLNKSSIVTRGFLARNTKKDVPGQILLLKILQTTSMLPLTDPRNYSRSLSGGSGTMKEPDLEGWQERLCTVARHSQCQGS
ncbi:hypothetical protein CK203_059481 [Vitis vinifera]|uniref:Uncharacterized protein n=1 Tax=Vitis vinifera TaxID=29760 RepID=A0A438GBR5_VITVI|nr:hypothetical protein CK203_059481 [Vitis vinifera]